MAPQVLLATDSAHPDGEPGGDVLLAALTARGITAEWVNWTDASVPWSEASVIAIRSTWDYCAHLSEFLAWTKSLPATALLHSTEVFVWNTDKKYLLELQAKGVRIVPTKYVTSLAELGNEVRGKGTVVVKPSVGASGLGVQLVTDAGAEWVPEEKGPWVVQPFVESIREEGELSVVVIDGVVTAQIRKIIAKGEFKANRTAGVKFEALIPGDVEAEKVAKVAYEITEKVVGMRLSYARIDLLKWQGGWVVSEVEVTEPSLGFGIVPKTAEHFAGMVKRRIGGT
ncbi:glutathione synthetase ATP-binding domain-like protein [Myriangium duriaei CBS 260.36]|uniref:Glutathione synthetase ATP-binding domain-like protein n=1 Tax=Myriangium duriaei CBS 260.36 TaxID=1168546 RepID=A0A9P4MDC7_9PEZI|nr:glutathione synthetase ATP-binding domain-like protein [Myriangium duriaei CBS 260.36]